MGSGLGDYPLRHLPIEILHDLIARAQDVNPQSPLDEIKLWLATKPPFAAWFIRGESITLNVGDSRIPVTAFRIPQGDVGVLVFFANAVGAAADYASVTFELDRDGAAIPGFASIIGPLTLSAQEPWRVMEPLTAGARVQVVATNTGTSQIQNVQAFLAGWYWTPQSHPGPAAVGG
jgi:hypothetical protein